MNWNQLMEWKIEKKNPTLRRQAVKLLAAFFIFMFSFTILSRAAVNLITPAVSLAAPEKEVLSYEITGAGTVEENQIQPVNVLSGIRIKNVPVREGDIVKEGDVLLELDLEDLNVKIAQKKQEMEKLDLGIRDIQAQKAQQQQEKQQAKQRAEEDYQKARQDTQNSVQRAQQDLAEADSRLAQWKPLPDESSKEEKALNQQEKAALEEARKQTQRAYEDAVKAQEEALTAAGRLVEDAMKPEVSDSSSETMQMDKQVLEEELSKMQALADQKGIIVSPISGTIKKLVAETGGITMDTMAMAVSDASAGGRFVAQIPAEQQKYAAKGDTVTLSSTNEEKKAEGLLIASVKENQEEDQMLDVVVLVPGDQMDIGATAVMHLKKTSRTYPCTIPVGALRTDGKGYFVLVVQEEQGILGSEWYAVRLDVTVLEKNEKTAAVKDGILGYEQRVIVSSDKPIEAGSRVRLEEE